MHQQKQLEKEITSHYSKTRLAKNAFPPENKLLLNKWKHKRTGNDFAHFIYFANLNICFQIKKIRKHSLPMHQIET